MLTALLSVFFLSFFFFFFFFLPYFVFSVAGFLCSCIGSFICGVRFVRFVIVCTSSRFLWYPGKAKLRDCGISCVSLLIFYSTIPVSALHKSKAGRHRPVRVADGPITACCRFM